MKKPYCLDLDGGVYSLGDLNMMVYNKDTVDYPPADPQDPAKPFFTGAIRQEVTVGGETRPFLVYIPSRFPISGAGLFLYPEDGVSCGECLRSDCWQDLAEEFQVALVILESRKGGWSREDIQSEVSYSEAVFKKAISRVYFSLNEATYYIMGLGAGAYMAAAHGLLSSSLFSCILADGDYRLAPELLEQLGRIRSDRDPLCSKLEVVMPAWLASRTGAGEDPVLACLQRANQTADLGLRAGGTRVFQQDVRHWQSSLDALPISEVRYTPASEAARLSAGELHREMLAFALRFKRWLSIGNGCFRPARKAGDMGLRRFTAQVDGRLREWHVYEPSAHRRSPDKKLPLLLAIHGYSCTGPMFAENCEWHIVGERRDFFVVYLSAFPSNKSFRGRTVPLPTWNAIGMDAETDDVRFVSHVLEDVKSRYPVDGERVYVSGHSNGSMFTQTLMKELPLPFAAFAPQGAQMHMDLNGLGGVDQRGIDPDGILRPVWLMMGSDDIGDQDKIQPGNANDRFIDMMCRVNGLDREKAQYLENGKYRTLTFPGPNGVPLLRFTGITDTPHTFTHEFAQIYWDQFLCHFRRLADGSIQYTL